MKINSKLFTVYIRNNKKRPLFVLYYKVKADTHSMQIPSQPFLETIYHLRTIEKVILYTKLEELSAKEEGDTLDFLESEYEKESLDYPFCAPVFNGYAAIWAAKIIYNSAQLLLHREMEVVDLSSIVPVFPAKTAADMLAADLCLRFLPQVLENLRIIDPNDKLIIILENILGMFPYSAIGAELENVETDLTLILEDDCLRQLYLDRVMHLKAIKEAENPLIYEWLLAGFGNHKKEFWPELKGR